MSSDTGASTRLSFSIFAPNCFRERVSCFVAADAGRNHYLRRLLQTDGRCAIIIPDWSVEPCSCTYAWTVTEFVANPQRPDRKQFLREWILRRKIVRVFRIFLTTIACCHYGSSTTRWQRCAGTFTAADSRARVPPTVEQSARDTPPSPGNAGFFVCRRDTVT